MKLGETLFAALVSGGLMSMITTVALIGPNIRKIRAEAKKTEADAKVVADGSSSTIWQQMIEEQRESLLEPIKEELARVRQQQAELLSVNERLRNENETMKHKYGKAIIHIRSLNSWIARHIPAGVEPPPKMPLELAKDF